jgi:uncharacterized membrane protein
MSVAYVLEILVRIPELHVAENKIDVHPMVWQLVVWSIGKRVADAEYVAVYLLVSLCSDVFVESMSGGYID